MVRCSEQRDEVVRWRRCRGARHQRYSLIDCFVRINGLYIRETKTITQNRLRNPYSCYEAVFKRDAGDLRAGDSVMRLCTHDDGFACVCQHRRNLRDRTCFVNNKSVSMALSAKAANLLSISDIKGSVER